MKALSEELIYSESSSLVVSTDRSNANKAWKEYISHLIPRLASSVWYKISRHLDLVHIAQTSRLSHESTIRKILPSSDTVNIRNCP
jgi:hypothetical protein